MNTNSIRRLVKPCLIKLVLIFLTGGCDLHRNKSVKLRLNFPGQENSIVQLTLNKQLNEINLVTDSLDSSGSCSLEINIDEPTIAYLQIGNQYGELYLAPGYDMAISGSTNSINEAICYSGSGSAVNNYFAQSNFLSEKIKLSGGVYIGGLSEKEFTNRFDSLSNALNAFHNHYIDSLRLSKAELHLLANRNKVKLASIYQEYLFVQINDAWNSRVLSTEINFDSLLVGLPEKFRSKEYSVFFDSSFLELGSFEYEYLLQTYLKINFHYPKYGAATLNGAADFLPLKTIMAIESSAHASVFKEYLMAYNVKYWLNTFGLTPSTDSANNYFRRNFPESKYLPALEKRYNALNNISAGSRAPDFTGTTLDGNPFALSDLKGKVVYIDMWATWCAPCLEEIPHSKRLQRQFADVSDLVFLFVSNDPDPEAWKRLLLLNNDWQGLHIIQTSDQIKLTWKLYNIAGLPTYILVDKKGNIADPNAARPSNEKTRDQINALLRPGG